MPRCIDEAGVSWRASILKEPGMYQTMHQMVCIKRQKMKEKKRKVAIAFFPVNLINGTVLHGSSVQNED